MRSSVLTRAVRGRGSAPDEGADDAKWKEPFAALRKKWMEVPTDAERVQVPRLLALSDGELLHFWDRARNTAVSGEYFSRRGWYHLLYEPLMRGARIVDFGSGLGMDGLSFAPHAAHVSFVDIAEGNLALVERIARLKELNNVDFVYLDDYSSLQTLNGSYDVILASGSLHNAPQSVTQREIQALAPRVSIGGRWLQLAYPRARWERDGKLPFSSWGEVTDGAGTPWCEWYDANKLLPMFAPQEFEVVAAFNYHHDDFVWFDLVRRP